uniref:Ig-like domain-containing protein n=1 Tax=Gadus morhua TaxID=8049 RepID=A0A8C5CU89_GADMO
MKVLEFQRLLFAITCIFNLLSICVRSQTEQEKKKNPTCAVFPKYQHVQFGSEVQVTCQSSCSEGQIYWVVNGQVVADRFSKSINSSHTVLSLKNFTYQSAIIQCHSVFNDLVLDGTIIKTYSKIIYLLIFLYITSVTMVCNWEHAMSSSWKITYTVQSTCCSDQKIAYCNSGTTSCVFKILPVLARNFSIVVKANSSSWEVKSDVYSFDPFQICKLCWKIKNQLHVTAHVSYLLVGWNQSDAIGNVIHCQVRYMSQSFDTFIRAWVTIEGVESCVVYTVSARCAVDRSPWSEWSLEHTAVTLLNPKTFQFNLWRKVVQQKSSGVREVKVMWTVRRLCRNTDAILIIVIYVTVIPLNNPSFNHDIQASAHGGIIQVNWQAPRHNVSGYIVDWTDDGKTYFWKRSNHTETKLYDLRDFRLYNITVTPVFSNKTGHGKKAPQVCSRRRGNCAIYISELRPEDTRAYVRWKIEAEDKCSTAVENFTVFCRQVEKRVIGVMVESRKAVLENLKQSTKYGVIVIAMGHTGNISSTETHFQTQKHGLKLLQSLIYNNVINFTLRYKTFLGKMVPNPGHSSLALWPSQSNQKVSQPLEGETRCVRVYPYEWDGARDCLVPPYLGDDSNPETAGEETEWAVPTPEGSSLSAGEDSETPTEEVELSADQAGLSVQDSREEEVTLLQEYSEVFLLPQSSPYRSQNAVPPQGPRSVKDGRELSGNKHSPMYVSMEMFREGPDRG